MINEFHNSIGNHRGSYKNKYNCAQKLANIWGDVKAKMERMVENGRGVTRISRMAYVTLLMMETALRIGDKEKSNEGYVSTNKYGKYFNKRVKTYGLTALQYRHFKIYPGKLVIEFLGKKQVQNKVKTKNKILIRYYHVITKNKMPADFVFSDFNGYELRKFIRRYVGRKYMSKDIRTAKINLIFLKKINIPEEAITSRNQINKIVKEVFIETAALAGHTVGVCRAKYVSPHLLFNYKKSLMAKMINDRKEKK